MPLAGPALLLLFPHRAETCLAKPRHPQGHMSEVKDTLTAHPLSPVQSWVPRALQASLFLVQSSHQMPGLAWPCRVEVSWC